MRHIFGLLHQQQVLVVDLPRLKKAIAGHRSLHGQNAFSFACSGIFLYLLLFLR